MTGDDSGALELRMIASGSTGNAAFVRAGRTTLLIDAGVSCRRLTESLRDVGASLQTIDALLITHEHGDHIKGLERVRFIRPDLPILTTARSAYCLRKKIRGLNIQTITSRRPFTVGEARVTPLPVSHDAQDPVCFRIDHGDASLGYATDLGVATADVEHALYDAQIIVLEANHCVEMLRRGPYPRRLKQRVASAKGHLSNTQARELLESVACERLEHVVLAHLSAKNNTPERAHEVVSRAVAHLDGVEVHVASPRAPGRSLRVTGAPPSAPSKGGAGQQQSLPF